MVCVSVAVKYERVCLQLVDDGDADDDADESDGDADDDADDESPSTHCFFSRAPVPRADCLVRLRDMPVLQLFSELCRI